MMTFVGDPGSARFESLGYVAFCAKLDNDPTFMTWFRQLRDDVDKIAASDRSEQGRLIILQNRLIDLITFLDPEGWRLPAKYRDRLVAPQPQRSEPEPPSKPRAVDEWFG
jgi:hypothetical protein